jgi:hypothetical protein
MSFVKLGAVTSHFVEGRLLVSIRTFHIAYTMWVKSDIVVRANRVGKSVREDENEMSPLFGTPCVRLS